MSKRTRKNLFFTSNSSNNKSSILLSWKATCRIIREYELTASAFDKWVQFKTSGSFKKKIILRLNKKELLELRKRNQQLEMKILF